ncbi:MAG: polyhydroxyalkanoate synthase [Cellvibrionaceae bacterium]|jgi:polyhydroxyalkanoate synthase
MRKIVASPSEKVALVRQFDPTPSAKAQSKPAIVKNEVQSDKRVLFSDNFFSDLDHNYQVWLSTLTAGVSPVSLALAYADWLMHLSISPGKMIALWGDALEKSLNFTLSSLYFDQPKTKLSITSTPKDKRFKDDAWDHFPFNLFEESYLSFQEWWQASINNVGGISRHHANVVGFVNNLILDSMSPCNFIATNPVVIKKIQGTYGKNLLDGTYHFFNDMQQLSAGLIPTHLQPFTIGKDLAVTPGKVVYRNRLIELIQYSPVTDKVYAEPLLIVPAWIMKYYILDLAPNKSLVEYLVEQGHTVFLISWKNPTAEDADLGFNDYMKLSVIESLNVINSIMPGQKVHATGYCIGGILLTIAAIWLAKQKDDRLQTVTLLASQTDFDKAGELLLFMDESQLSLLNHIMQQQGYMDKFQLKNIFQIMHAKELIWDYFIEHYLLGEQPPISELMAWSADATRMPFTMHKEYLERFYLHDLLAEGDYQVDGEEVVLSSLTLPIFYVATEKDYLSPWRSVYKLHLFTNTELTFVLTNGGHNSGIASLPSESWHHYQMGTSAEGAPYISPDKWLEQHPKQHSGSWWIAWHKWLVARSASTMVALPSLGNDTYLPLCDAPGTYVHQA